MDKYEIVKKIENFAPPELAEKWDCSGWSVETQNREINRVMLCLTVTDEIVKQAKEKDCEMIVSHHPSFFVPLKWKDVDIYSAHTNLDRTHGGTTDTLIETIFPNVQAEILEDGFTRVVDYEISVAELAKKLRQISPNLRYVNNNGMQVLKKIAFCAGSGNEFIEEARKIGVDAFVTGDLKFHSALESHIVLFDIGHFESEILVLSVFERLLEGVETVRAIERSPFIY